MDCTLIRRLFPALMAGDLPAAEAAQAEEHLQTCEDCSREFEAYESRFFREYEPAWKALGEVGREALSDAALEKYAGELRARLSGPCAKVGAGFAAYVHGDLAGSAREELEAHLQGCEACSRQFEAYEARMFAQYERAGKALAAAAAVLPPEGPMVGFYQKVAARIAADRRGKGVRRYAWMMNAAAIFVIAVSVGYLAGGKGEPVSPAQPSGIANKPETGLPPVIRVEPGLAAPASTASPQVRHFGVPNRRLEEVSPDQRRRPGAVDVIQPEGFHLLDETRPMQDGESVGF